MPDLPPPRADDRPYAILLVCLGNICRSPMAQVVLESRIAGGGLGEQVTVTSAGTGDWHVGERMDPRAAKTLRAAGYDPSRHRARQVDAPLLATQDLVLAMDGTNLADLRAMASDDATWDRVAMFRAWDDRGGPDAAVPDPYWGGGDGFAGVLATVERTSAALVQALVAGLPPPR